MAAIFQMTFSNAFPWIYIYTSMQVGPIYQFCLRFRWNLFLRVQLTIFQHWFRSSSSSSSSWKSFYSRNPKIYKYRMETETLEGLYVPSSIFNSHYTIISSFVPTQVSRWVWEKKKYKIKTSSKSGCAIGNTSMNSVVHISKIMSVQSYSRFHHFLMCLTHWGQNKNGGQFTIIFKPIYSNKKNIFDSDFTEIFSQGSN